MRISDWSSDVCSSDLSAATGLTNVLSGGTLGGSGTIGGSVTVADGGRLAPGNSPGTLTINGDLTLNGASILDLEFGQRSEEHTSELQSLMRISYAVFCLKKKKITQIPKTHNN